MQSSMKHRASSWRVCPIAWGSGMREVGAEGSRSSDGSRQRMQGVQGKEGFVLGGRGFCPGRQGFSLRSDDG